MNWYRLRNLIWWLPDAIQAKLNPVKYAKRKGVRMLGRVYFYGIPRLSTEPWLITLGDNVHITRDVEFITHDGGVLILRDQVPDLELTQPIRVGNNVYIGVHSIILPGVTIGNRCIIAAGSIVTKDVPDNSVVGGVPARFIETVDEYRQKAESRSLHLGHLDALEKEKKLREYYHIQGR